MYLDYRLIDYEEVPPLIKSIGRSRHLVYLSSPYSKYPAGIDIAHYEVCLIAGKLFNLGIKIYCPIAHCHTIAKLTKLAIGFKYWQEYNRTMLDRSNILLVATMQGWDVSEGVIGEITYAQDIGIPIYRLKV